MTTPIEMLQRVFKKGPEMISVASNANQFAGRTTLASGSAVMTISTTQVNSDSLIFLSLQQLTAANSGALCVRSINSGVAFTVGWSDAAARGFDATVMWEVKKTS